jgi:hypothetical protein
MADDPFKPVIKALAVLATPNPTMDLDNPPANPQGPTVWENSNATGTGVLTVIALLMQQLYTASTDMHKVGVDISTALDQVVAVVNKLADALGGLNVNDVTNAMDGLQQALAMAQTLAPGSGGTVLDSGSKLFKQIQDLLTATNSIALSAAELAQLGQLLKLLSTNLKPNP